MRKFFNIKTDMRYSKRQEVLSTICIYTLS